MTREQFFREILQRMGIPIDRSSAGVYNAAVEAGLTTQSLGDFRGDDVITRGEAATVLVRSTGQEVGSTQEGLQAAVDLGLFQSVGDGSAEFLNRYFEDVMGRGEGVLFTSQPAGSEPAASEPAGSQPAASEPAGADPVTETDTVDPNELADARVIINEKLALYGLEGLTDFAYEMLVGGANSLTVLDELTKTEEYQTRFKGLELRRRAGLPQISPAEYIRLESDYRQAMVTAGIPSGFYDSPDDFAEFIGNDVSGAEMQARVSMAAAAVNQADPNLKSQLRDLYGIGVENEGELVAYYLDPERGTSVIEQRLQLEAAGLSSTAMATLGQGFERGTAERLADLDVQQREISERLKGQRAVTQQLVGEQEAMTASEFAAAEFGLDSEATADLARLRRQRQERGRRQMGAALGQAGAIGLRRAT